VQSTPSSCASRTPYQQQPDGAAVNPDTIEFHKSDGSTFAFLSLFHQGEGFISEEGTTYDSVGKMLFHVKMVVLQRPDIAAQILKVTGEGYARRIRSPTMRGATGYISDDLLQKWNHEKRNVMWEALKLKFANPALAEKLKATSPRPLKEKNETADSGMLAALLMELRAELLAA
jgi:predicted NAD-dependent protein-ADP-ribosyltransferase YbiA (DUF1768 family)